MKGPHLGVVCILTVAVTSLVFCSRSAPEEHHVDQWWEGLAGDWPLAAVS